MPAFSPELLRARREAAGKSKEQVAVDIARTYMTVHKLERGEIRPSIETLGRLCHALVCSPTDLFTTDDEPTDDTRPTDLGADVDAWIARTLASAPPLTAEQRAELRSLLRGVAA